jgi:hypothetical protein
MSRQTLIAAGTARRPGRNARAANALDNRRSRRARMFLGFVTIGLAALVTTSCATTKHFGSRASAGIASATTTCAPGALKFSVLAVTRTGVPGATTRRVGPAIVLRAVNGGSTSCVLSGAPSWEVVDEAGNAVHAPARVASPTGSAPVSLAPSHEAQTWVYWFGSSCPEPAARFGLRVHDPAGGPDFNYPATSWPGIQSPGCSDFGGASTGSSETVSTPWGIGFDGNPGGPAAHDTKN